ncbi:MAG: OmpA family protein, partial [Bacteroidota bacterium]
PDEAGIAARNGCPEPEEVFENITDRIDRYRRLIDGFEYITLDESTGVIQIQNVYFATDRSNRDQLDRAILDEVAELLQREGAEDISIRFEGHADRRASEEYNQRLSERRAEGAMQYVIDKGVDASRVSMIGFGELQPVGDVDDLQANRVSISVVNEPPRRIE